MKQFVILIVLAIIAVSCIFVYKVIDNVIVRNNLTASQAECRKLSKENAKLDNTVKTQSSSIEALKACIVSKDKTIASHVATINSNTELTGKLTSSLTNAQVAVHKLQQQLKSKSKTPKRKIYTKKRIYKPVKKTGPTREEKR